MYVNVAVLKETHPHERRVALVPSVVAKLIKLGAKLHMQSGAGDAVSLVDAAFKDVTFIADRHSSGQRRRCGPRRAASCVGCDRRDEGRRDPDLLYLCEQGAGVGKAPFGQKDHLLRHGAHSAHHAGAGDGRAVQSIGAWRAITPCNSARPILARVLPKITSAAGAIGPAKVLVMGLGVAGLEAVATAHRLGAVVEGYDVRPETAEQVASLGATFVETGVDARGKGGYARELTAAEKAKIDAVVTKHIQQSDLIITTAAIPGRPSPKLISKSQVAGMKAGAVIVDLSAEGGGNCEDTQPGETAQIGQVTIVAPLNVPSLLGRTPANCMRRINRSSARSDDEGQHHHAELGR